MYRKLLMSVAILGTANIVFGSEPSVGSEVSGEMNEFPNAEEIAAKKSLKDRLDITGFIELSAQRTWDKLGGRRSPSGNDYPAWRLALPSGIVWAEFEIGKGWSVGTQVSLDNIGTVDMKEGVGNADERSFNWDCSLALQEMWIQKSFSDAANLKVGLIGTPVGQQNDYPTQFFGVVRPEQGPAMLALNNQSPSGDFNGESGAWSYDIMAIPGFVNFDFGNEYWSYGDGAYQRTINRLYAGAFRLNNNSVEGLTIGVSGEFGGGTTNMEYEGVEGDSYTRRMSTGLALAGMDWLYDNHNMVFRGAYQYGYMSCKDKDRTMISVEGPLHDMQAMSLGAEFGYDFFSLNSKLAGKQKFYVFGRYDWANRQDYKKTGTSDWMDIQRITFGINWFPMKQILVKADFGFGFDNDPSRIFAGCSISWLPEWL